MKKIIAAAAVLLCIAAPVNAQAFLNKLEDKAKSKVTGRVDKKVDQVMDKALNKVFGVSDNNNNASQQQSTSSSSGMIDNALGLNTSFGANLYSGNSFQYNVRQGYDEYELKSNLKFANYADALTKIVDLPSAKELLDAKGREKFSKKMQEVEAAMDALVLANNNAMVAAATANTGVVEKSSKKSSGTAVMSSEEVIAACSAAGVNLATATPQQVIDACVPVLSKKIGCTEAEARVLLMQGVDPQSEGGEIDRCNKIYDQLSNISTSQLEAASAAAMASLTSIQSALLGGGGSTATQTATIGGALANMAKQFGTAWEKSEECKKVNALQQNLAKKGADAAAIAKEQDAIIAAWNEKQAEKWMRKISEFLKTDLGVAKVVADLDAELDGMSAETKKDYSWTMAKRQSTSLNYIICDYVLMPAAALLYPEVKGVNEQYR